MWREMVDRGYAKLLAYYQGQPVAGTLAFIRVIRPGIYMELPATAIVTSCPIILSSGP